MGTDTRDHTDLEALPSYTFDEWERDYMAGVFDSRIRGWNTPGLWTDPDTILRLRGLTARSLHALMRHGIFSVSLLLDVLAMEPRPFLRGVGVVTWRQWEGAVERPLLSLEEIG